MSARSKTATSKPFLAKPIAAVSPPIPAPAISARGLTGALWRLSAGLDQFAFRRQAMGSERRIIDKAGRAIGADRIVVGAHVDENMRVVERWCRARTHEFLDADFDDGNAGIIVEMRRGMFGHRGSAGP